MKIYILLIFVIIFSCNEIKKQNLVTIRKLDTIIIGNIIGDTLFNDTIKYYNLDDKLVSYKIFKNGRQEGLSTDFYPNGNPHYITSYTNGIKNGYSFYFDSSGNLMYKDYYYYGLIAGPIIFFNKGEPKRYFFSNLQNEDLISINYEEWKGVKEVFMNCINFTKNFQKRDSTRELSLFLYLINPPKFTFKYTIFKKKKNDETGFTEVETISTALPFAQISLPMLPKDDHYVIGLNVYDSIIGKQTKIYKDL